MLKRCALLLICCGLRLCAADASWIEKLGGTVERDSAGRIVAVNLRGSWISDVDMIELARMPDLERLDLSHTRITDEGMLNLKPAPKISELKLFYSEWITDQGMRAPMAQRRGIAFLLCVFSAVAVALAAIGIYSVISYATGLRVQEIGIRMAYGPDIRTR